MLGFGDQQGHQTLPRSLFRCLHISVSQLSSRSQAIVQFLELICSVHPTLDILVTGGRDAAVRVWDMRTRANIFTLSGHSSTVADVKCQSADPQIISGSMDSTIK